MAAKTTSNLALRLATAAVATPLILLLLYKGPAAGFYALVFAAMLLGAFELFAMTHPGDRVAQSIGVVLSGVSSLVVYAYAADARAMLTLFVALALIGPLVTLVRLGEIPTAALRAFAMSAGPIFVGVPITLLAMLRRDLPHGASYVVLTLMFAWWGDTGGYFAGRYLGKRKLYEAVSPKKTIAGSLGSLGGSVLGALCAHFWYLPTLPLVSGVVLALVAGAFGQAGDLAESLIKRSTGVKDSGAIIPGHGGILDRVDAVIFASVVVYVYLAWCPPIG